MCTQVVDGRFPGTALAPDSGHWRRPKPASSSSLHGGHPLFFFLPFISRLEHKRGYLLGICAAYSRLIPSACGARIRPSSPMSQKCFWQKFFDFQIRKQSRCPSTPTTRNHTPPTLWWGFTPGTSRWSWSNPILHLRHQRLSWFNPNLHKQIFLV